MALKISEGSRFGKWTVLEFVRKDDRHTYWKCKHDDGTVRVRRRDKIIGTGNGYSYKSKHEGYPDERRAYRAMRARCNNPNNKNYDRYGGRGIRVCFEWMLPDGFDKFLEEVGPRPGSQFSLDRIDNDGHYEPGNVRWVDKKTQARNRHNNRLIEFNGEALVADEWAERLGMSADTLRTRLYKNGWSVERALTEPVDKSKRAVSTAK